MSLSTTFQYQPTPYSRSTAMLSMSTNSCNPTTIYTEWKLKSKLELKTKIQGNYVQRANTSVNTINKVIKHYTNIALFQLSRVSITNTLRSLFSKVDEWTGVDIQATRSDLQTFQQYFQRADNWWNRYKAEWIGDYFFSVLCHQQIKEYITNITHNSNCMQCTAQYSGEYNVNRDELLLLLVIKELMHSRVKFKRSKKQPLILDQCYSKSVKLQECFTLIGNENSVNWELPRNNTKNKDYRNIIRNYASNWIDRLITAKLSVLRVDKIENINLGMYVCNHQQQQTHTCMQQNGIQNENNINCCHQCNQCNVMINSRNPQMMDCKSQISDIQTQYTYASDNIPMITAPFNESQPFYPPVFTYRYNPYNNHNNVYPQHQYANDIPVVPSYYNYNNCNYDRVRGPSINIAYASQSSQPVHMANLNNNYCNECETDNMTYCEPWVANNMLHNNYNETVMFDNNEIMAEPTQVCNGVINDNEMDPVFTNSVYNYSFNGVFH